MAFERIKSLVGKSSFLDNSSDIDPYVTAWRGGAKGVSSLVVFPSSTEQVSEIVKICNSENIPIVPQGGRTGLVGGNLPDSSGKEIILNLSRMNKIISIDSEESVLTAQAGCILQVLQEESEAKGFLFPMSIASEGSAELGGLLSTNAGGTSVIRYGNMRDLTLGLELVLPDGSILNNLSPLRKDNTGYDLKNLFIGAEGTLGIITAASLKLYAKPKETITAYAAVDNIAKAIESLKFLRQDWGDTITAYEIISSAAKNLTVKSIPGIIDPIPGDQGYLALIEISSNSEPENLRASIEKTFYSLIEKNIFSNVIIAESIKQANDFWNLREHIPEAIKKAGKGIYFDISLPLSKLSDFVEKTNKQILSEYPEIELAIFGHAGDGNLHYNMYLPSKTVSADFSKIHAELENIVYKNISDFKGSISAEHGIGVSKKELLKLYSSDTKLDLMKKIKQAIDPKNIMNPGKIFDL